MDVDGIHIFRISRLFSFIPPLEMNTIFFKIIPFGSYVKEVTLFSYTFCYHNLVARTEKSSRKDLKNS